MSWQIDCRASAINAACRKLQQNDAQNISIRNDKYFELSALLVGQPLRARTARTCLSLQLSRHKYTRVSYTHTHSHTLTVKSGNKRNRTLQRFEFVKGYFSHYNKKWGRRHAAHVITTQPASPHCPTVGLGYAAFPLPYLWPSRSPSHGLLLAGTLKCRTAEKSYKHK